MSTAPATGGARAASDGLRRARDAILEILAEDDDDGDDSTSSSGEDVDGSMRFASLALEDEEATEAREGLERASTATPRGSAIDAGVAKLEARGRAMLDAAASEERRAAVDMREAREGLERAMEEARGASRDAAALERAVAERDLEIFKRDEELTRLREENARLREEASAVSSSRASAEAFVSGAVEEANRRASEAEAGARAMREALKVAETKHAGERARLMDELRQSRASLASRARELDSRARTEAHGSGRLDEVGAARKEADALAKKVDVAEAVAAKLEVVVAQKAEEIFEVTQERDALRKKMKTTSETIDSLEREWLEMSRAGSSEQEALMEENEELHKIIDQLKSNEKEGFAAAEDEITALKARLHHLEHDQGPTNRSVDRNLARESITSLRAKLRELKDEIAEKNARIEDSHGGAKVHTRGCEFGEGFRHHGASGANQRCERDDRGNDTSPTLRRRPRRVGRASNGRRRVTSRKRRSSSRNRSVRRRRRPRRVHRAQSASHRATLHLDELRGAFIPLHRRPRYSIHARTVTVIVSARSDAVACL